MQVQKQLSFEEASSLEAFVKDATWKDLLIELVRKNELDPWNIDITKLVASYIATIRQMRLLDLHIPANIMLAAALLVRLKSDMLSFGNEAEQEEEYVQSPPNLEASVLLPKLRLPVKRKITLDELISAMDEALKIKEERERRSLEHTKPMPIVVYGIDITEEANELYNIISSSRHMEFSKLVEMLPEKDPLLEIFVPLLFLANENKVELFQEQFFGEIRIRVV